MSSKQNRLTIGYIHYSKQVIDELKSYDTIVHPRNNFCCDFNMPMAVGRKKRMIWWPYPTYYGGSDAQTVFQVCLIDMWII